MREFIEYIARCLVDRPDEVQVHETAGETSCVYEIRAGDGELGKIIGKHGNTIRAIRTILMGVAAKEHKRVRVEILE